jgi:hypothetical protein
MAETLIPRSLKEAVRALWDIPAPGPSNLLSDPRFVSLRDICDGLYSKAKSKDALAFPVRRALRALGLPLGLVPANSDLAFTAEDAAARLDAAFRKTHVRRVHLCPLDWAGDLPTLKFGPNGIQKLTAAALEKLVDPSHLKRINPNWTFDAERFSEFRWMVVEETCLLNQEPGVRAGSFLLMSSGRDWGRIEPHKELFPTAVQKALFAVLLAPWEDWAESPDYDWRCFRVPWVHTLSDDIFVRPLPPPSPDTLSWEPLVFHDNDGNIEFETEQPSRYYIRGAAAEMKGSLNNKVWSDVGRAQLSHLLSDTPIAHFFVRAFLAEPLDEFLAHISTIEAALGLPNDYPGGTRRLRNRVSALLGAGREGEDYNRLFNLRSAFLHGRAMDAIPGKERVVARRLARRVVNAVVEAAVAAPALQSREAYLRGLD